MLVIQTTNSLRRKSFFTADTAVINLTRNKEIEIKYVKSIFNRGFK